MKTFRQTNKGENNVMIYEIKHLEENKIQIRGLFQGAEVGDKIQVLPSNSITTGNLKIDTFEVVQIVEVKDSKGCFENPDLAKNAHVTLVASF